MLVAVAALAPGWCASIPIFRAVACLTGAVFLMRTIDLARQRQPLSAPQRLLHVFSIVDPTLLRRAPRALEPRTLGFLLLWLSSTGAGIALVFVVGEPHGWTWLPRWLGGLVAAYSAVEALWFLLRLVYRAAGFDVPVCHRFPAASLQVSELWGERWARPISSWLNKHVFRPLVRRGHPGAGLLASFAVSGLVHGYPILATASLLMTGAMLAFFLAQALLIVVEGALRVTAWSPVASRAWTVSALVLTSPLFVEPALRAAGLTAHLR